MQVRVKVDFRAVKRALGALEKQIPFATSLALNNTAKEVRGYLKDHLADTMTLRKKWTQGGIQQANSTKRKLVVAVGSIDPYMAAQEKAGVRKAKVGGRKSASGGAAAMAVPTKNIRRNPRTKITDKNRPSSFILGKKQGRMVLKPKHFIQKVKSGAVILFRRKFKKKPYPITPLWVFVRRVRIGLAKKWKLKDQTRSVVERVWAQKALEAVAEAVATARK